MADGTEESPGMRPRPFPETPSVRPGYVNPPPAGGWISPLAGMDHHIPARGVDLDPGAGGVADPLQVEIQHPLPQPEPPDGQPVHPLRQIGMKMNPLADRVRLHPQDRLQDGEG